MRNVKKFDLSLFLFWGWSMALVIGKSILSEGFWMSYLLEGPRRGQKLKGLLLAQGSRIESLAEGGADCIPCPAQRASPLCHLPHPVTCMWKLRVAQELHSVSGSFILPVLECSHGPIEV